MKTRSVITSRSPVRWIGLTLLAAGGCGPDLFYLPSIALGQLDAILNSVPLERAIATAPLDEEQISKLELIIDVRAFAEQAMGLDPGESFTLFVDTGPTSNAYNISASAKHRFQPMHWTFPLIGSVPYLVYFDLDQAERYVQELVDRNLDVFMYEVDAYSTMNAIPNPVRSAMLRRDEISIVDTVIHELLHDNVWRLNATTFNESLATFYGRTGAQAYFRDRFPDQPELAEQAVTRYADYDRFTAYILDLYGSLETYYADPGTPQSKIAGREALYQQGRDRFFADVHPFMNIPENFDWVERLPTNNAWMLANYRYNLDLDVFQAVFDATGQNWRTALEVFGQAAAADEPIAFMNAWLADAEPAG